jgi:sortase (surface protein transpeptidase)
VLAVLLCALTACSATASPTPAAQHAAPPPVAAPVAIDIPAIGAHSSLIETGLNADGTIETPPVEQPGQASWFRSSPRPGAPGPAVVLGHVDGGGRLGVFHGLRDLKVGDEADIARADGSTVEFEVYRVDHVDKDAFPTAQVYGDTAGPELRLITCGGVFDHQAHSYVQNVVVYARQEQA